MLRRLVLAAAVGLAQSASNAGADEPVHRVGVLMATETPENAQALLEGLRERGYVVGRNFQIDYRYSQGRTEQIPALVAELVALGPEVIVASTAQNVVAVHAAAPTVPLVFIAVADPVALGLVESLAHPGGNVTEFTTLVQNEDFLGKSLQLLKELVPRASRIALLINPTNPIHQQSRPKLPGIGRLLGVELIIVEASRVDHFETAFETAHTQGAEAIRVSGDPLTFTHSAKVVGLAARYQLPAMYLGRRYVQDGGLMSYAPNNADFWQQVIEARGLCPVCRSGHRQA